MDPTKKSCFYIGPRCGGLIVGYTFTFLATFQLIFLTEKNLLSIFSVILLSLSVRWNCGIISKTPEFLAGLLMLVTTVCILGAVGCINFMILEFFLLASNLFYDETDYAFADSILVVLPCVMPIIVLLWFLSTYMESIYNGIKKSVESSTNPRQIQSYFLINSDYLKKMKELSDKVVDKSGTLLEISFGMWYKTENTNLDVEKPIPILNTDLCKVKVDLKSNEETDAKNDLKSMESVTTKETEQPKQ